SWGATIARGTAVLQAACLSGRLSDSRTSNRLWGRDRGAGSDSDGISVRQQDLEKPMSRERGRWRGCTCGCCLSMLVGFSHSALAAPEEANALPESLEEVVVTSRRRSESLQDVPLAVTVLTERAIRDAGVERV